MSIDEAPAGLSGWTKPAKPILAEIQQAGYWMSVFQYLTSCYRDTYVRNEPPIIQDHMYSVDNHLAQLGVEIPDSTLSFEQYAVLVELFWGADAAKESMEYVLAVTGNHASIDPQSQSIQLNPDDMSTVNTEQYTVQSIQPHGGVDEVTLTILFSLADPQEPYKVITY